MPPSRLKDTGDDEQPCSYLPFCTMDFAFQTLVGETSLSADHEKLTLLEQMIPKFYSKATCYT